MNRVQGKVAVVTGAALGIGKACALMLAREGATVAVTDMLDAERELVVAEITRAGGVAKGWHLDVTNEEEVKNVFADIDKTFGAVTVLVNNAGIGGAGKPTHELTSEEWDRVQNVNVKGVFFCTKYAIPQMLRAGTGSIIHMSSIYGLVGAADAPPYHASKGAVTLMAKTDAMFYAAQNIRVNSVHPGFIWTPLVEKFVNSMPDPEAMKKGLAALHPIGRIGEADDVAYGVVYLASDEAKFVTGSELVIDGGYTAR
jgi:NAD(P)-dependent dehydrogenase (short-subunit alcohol dehydrogenase family)